MEYKKSEILVVGSVVKDTIVSYSKKKITLGGTGTNISFGLGVLGLNPTIVSVAGKDSKEFLQFFKKNKISQKIEIFNKKRTAEFLAKIDKKGKEKTFWKPNVFNKIEEIKLVNLFSKKELENFKIIIFSPGTPKSTVKHIKEFKNLNKKALVIFDPGQMTEFYTKKQVEESIKFSDFLILNELEFGQLSKILKKDLLKLFKNKILIKTLGEKGSQIFQNNKIIFIPVIQAKKIVSTVGAGDTYRVGLIYGLLNKMSLESSCKLGARFSSRSVGSVGCKKYFFKI